MKKTFKATLFVALLFGTSFLTYSQVSLGGQLGYAGHPSLSIGQMSFGIRGEYAFTKKNAISISFNYYKPKIGAYPASVHEIDQGFNMMPTLQVDGEVRFSGINVNVEGKRYTFGKEFGDILAPYFICGAALNSFKYSSEITGYYDKELYQPNDQMMFNESFTGFSINLGMGVDYKLGDNMLFLDVKGLLPANKVNGQTIEVVIPFTYAIQLGYRIVL